MTEVPVQSVQSVQSVQCSQCSAVQKQTTKNGTKIKETHRQARPYSLGQSPRFSSPQLGLGRSPSLQRHHASTRLRSSLACHPLYRAVHTQPEPDSESPHPQHTPTSTGLRYVLLRYARTSPKQNLSTCPKPKGPRLSPALLYIHARRLLTLVRSTLRLL